MSTVTTYDRRGNQVTLQPTAIEKMYEQLDSGGKGTGCLVNLKTALGCGSLFTEEQHEKYLAKKAKRQGK
mgnify:CR=1 FL=1